MAFPLAMHRANAGPRCEIESVAVSRDANGCGVLLVTRRVVGVFQMHGRPDGRPPLFEFYRSLRDRAREQRREFSLGENDVAELLEEAGLYTERARCFNHVHDRERAERDTAQARLIIRFGMEHSPAGKADGFLALARELNEFPDSGARAWEYSPASEAALTLAGDYWKLSFQGEPAYLKKCRGLQYLVQLLEQPGREFHTSEFTSRGHDRTLENLGHAVFQAPPTLDQHAKAEFKQRLVDLRAEHDDAERCNDLLRAAQLREEINSITQHLASAVGLGGRDRKTGSDAERSRCAVTKRIKHAIAAISNSHPTLGHHLRKSVRTGYFCCYEPDPDCSITWRIEGARALP